MSRPGNAVPRAVMVMCLTCGLLFQLLNWRTHPGTVIDSFRFGEFRSNRGHRLQYALYEPPDRALSEALPVVVVLNAIESSGRDGRQQLKNRVAFSLRNRILADDAVPCLALFPQSERSWSGGTAERECLRELVREIVDAHNADASRMLLVGIADGARGAIQLAVEQPEMWDGAVLLSGATAPFVGHLPAHFPVVWYRDPPDTSGSGSVPELQFLHNEHGGRIRWVDRAFGKSGDLWALPGFHEWLTAAWTNAGTNPRTNTEMDTGTGGTERSRSFHSLAGQRRMK